MERKADGTTDSHLTARALDDLFWGGRRAAPNPARQSDIGKTRIPAILNQTTYVDQNEARQSKNKPSSSRAAPPSAIAPLPKPSSSCASHSRPAWCARPNPTPLRPPAGASTRGSSRAFCSAFASVSSRPLATASPSSTRTPSPRGASRPSRESASCRAAPPFVRVPSLARSVVADAPHVCQHRRVCG